MLKRTSVVPSGCTLLVPGSAPGGTGRSSGTPAGQRAPVARGDGQAAEVAAGGGVAARWPLSPSVEEPQPAASRAAVTTGRDREHPRATTSRGSP